MMIRPKPIHYNLGESIRKYQTNLPVSFVYCDTERVGKKRIMPEYELIIVLDGRGFINMDGRRYDMVKNSVALFPPDKFVYYESTGRWKILALGFAAKRYKAFEQLKLQNSPVWQISEPENAMVLIDNILRLSKTVFSGNNLELLDVNCEALLLTIAEQSKAVTRRRQSVIDKIFSYINEHYESDIKIDFLCGHFGISRSLFFKLWSGKVQISPNAYITQIKMRRACALLKSTDMRISEIAQRLSFEDPRYFSRKFKQQLKLSPRAYRNAGKE